MDMLTDLILALSKWTRFHLSDIALTIMVTALVLFGPSINAWARRSIGHLNVALRIVIFALVCIVAYGLSVIYITPLFTSALGNLNNYTLAPVLVMIFILMGILAERN